MDDRNDSYGFDEGRENMDSNPNTDSASTESGTSENYSAPQDTSSQNTSDNGAPPIRANPFKIGKAISRDKIPQGSLKMTIRIIMARCPLRCPLSRSIDGVTRTMTRSLGEMSGINPKITPA